MSGREVFNVFFLLLQKPQMYNVPEVLALPRVRVNRGLLTGMRTMAAQGLAASATLV